jgi:hypothetical protein
MFSVRYDLLICSRDLDEHQFERTSRRPFLWLGLFLLTLRASDLTFSVRLFTIFFTEIYASIFSLISSVFCGNCEAFSFESAFLFAFQSHSLVVHWILDRTGQL